jgi:hypothetical protein
MLVDTLYTEHHIEGHSHIVVPDMRLHNQNIEDRIEGRYYTVQSNVQYKLNHIKGLKHIVDCDMLL